MSQADTIAESIVQKMYEKDTYSQWLGINRLSVSKGSCILEMKIRKEMLNGFGIAHGSMTYALADSALAFASNSHGKHCLSIDTQISHILPCKLNDVIRAEAKEIQRSKSLARYDVEIKNQEDKLVAHFRGTVFIKDVEWDLE